MKKISMSITACVLLSTSMYANSINDAFTNGKVSGEISVFTKTIDEANTDKGYSMGSVSLAYETKSYNGLKGALNFISNSKFSEKNASDYDETVKSVLNIANLSYSNDDYSITVGRQGISSEWIGDKHEAIVGVAKITPEITLTAGYTKRINGSGNDGSLSNFSTIGVDGGYFIDTSYKASDLLTLEAYYMNVNELFSGIGANVILNKQDLTATLKYAASSEEVNTTENGDIFALDLAYDFKSFKVNGGYIQTDEDGGIGSLSTMGDNINPVDSGSNVYSADAKTAYIAVETNLSGFDLATKYASTEYASAKQSEINFSISKELAKNLSISGLYVNVDGDTSANDNEYLTAQLVYSF